MLSRRWAGQKECCRCVMFQAPEWQWTKRQKRGPSALATLLLAVTSSLREPLSVFAIASTIDKSAHVRYHTVRRRPAVGPVTSVSVTATFSSKPLGRAPRMSPAALHCNLQVVRRHKRASKAAASSNRRNRRGECDASCPLRPLPPGHTWGWASHFPAGSAIGCFFFARRVGRGRSMGCGADRSHPYPCLIGRRSLRWHS